MKNSKFTKILTLTLTAALLVVMAFAFNVSAAETTATDPALAIAGKNVVYGDTLTIQYAVSTSKISSGAELVVSNSVASGSTKYSHTETTSQITGTEDTYYVFEVTDIPASDVCEEITVYVKDGEKVGPELKYSLAEYFYERLYADDVVNATEGKALYQKELYLTYLDYAASAQNLFKNFEKELGVTLVTDYYYACIQDGTLDSDGNVSAIFDSKNETASVTLAYEGTAADFSGWNVTTYTASGSSTEKVGATATVTLTGHTVITPAYLTTLTEGETFDSLTTLIGDGTDSDVMFGKTTCSTANRGQVQDGDEIAIATDPTGRDNNVLKFKDGSTGSGVYSTVRLNVSGNALTNGMSVFETKLYVPSSGITGGSTIAQLSFNNGDSGLGNMNLTASSDKSSVYLSISDTTDSETGKNISTDAWHVLRLEFYNSATYADNYVEVYIDNLYAGKITYAGTSAHKDANGFCWKGYSGGLTTFYFDNMSLTEKALPTE